MSISSRCALFVAAGIFLGGNSKGLAVESPPVVDPRAVILASQGGDSKVDQEIARLQGKLRATPTGNALAVQLGWAFVAKARNTGDPGSYKLAEQCAQLDPNDSDARLLRGHVFHALHRFKEAENAARQLTSDKVSRWQTYALLGDALMEQGQLAEAIDAYQRMIDIRPCLQTYARVAHLRWLRGDLAGAEELMVKAVEASSSRDPEPAAWAYTRLALYQFQTGKIRVAARSVSRALEFVKDYPAALLLESKIDIADGDSAKAVHALELAVAQTPLPEYQWALADAARLAGDAELAIKTEEGLIEHGATEDPRTFALFLATRRAEPDKAWKLAQAELANRRDVFSYDAAAWSALAAGRKSEAEQNMKLALAEGTADARLFYHAGRIAAATGDDEAAASWFRRSSSIQQMLFPSEKADLDQQMSALTAAVKASPRFSTTNQQLADKAAIRKKQ